ncbi:MAG: hypothetical protein Q9192_002566 [Flavoplaca navasiana]
MSDAYSSFHRQQPKQQEGPLEERTIQEDEIIVKEARQLSWKKAPHFVHKSLVAGLGKTKKVILASNDGQYPNRIVAASFTTMTGRWWDDNHNYWTIDLNQQRIIVTKLGGNRINGYRQCIGVQDNAMVYSRKCVAFDAPSKDLEVARRSGASTQRADDLAPRPRSAQRSRQAAISSPEHLLVRASHLSNPTVNTGRRLPELTVHPIASTPSPKIEPFRDVNPLIRPSVLTEQVIGRRKPTEEKTGSDPRTTIKKAMLEEELRDVKRQKASLVQTRDY